MKVDALILCGGAATRMQGLDKGLQRYQGQTLVEHALQACRAWPLGQVWISANRNLDAYRSYGQPVLSDLRAGFPGPLAGIEAGLAASQAEALLVLPCDVLPYPANLLALLQAGLEDGVAVVSARDNARSHPAVCLLRSSQRAEIARRLDAGQRGVMRWQQAVGGREVWVAERLENRNTLDSLLDPA